VDEHLREERLLTRGTFGPRPGEIARIRSEGAAAWLREQLDAGGAPDPELALRLRDFPSLTLGPADAFAGIEFPPRMSAGEDRSERDTGRFEALRLRAREITGEVVGARVVRAVYGRWGLREVLVDFWSNHFSVFARKHLLGGLLPHYQREVLDRHALGRFEDLLRAVARSPAMLVYLDNWSSTAPQRRGRRGGSRRGGINENYARELLELHTLGVDGGYTQADVREVARVFTGWTLESRREPLFRFRESLHDPGDKRVLGERVRGSGADEGEQLLRRLAQHPATARHLAHKLVARFVDDHPPSGLVARAAERFLETGGEIREVLALILMSPEFADPAHRKLKTPLRFATSALRATGGATDGDPRLLRALGRLGEVPFFARTPAGFPEETAHWVDPGAMLERMGLAFALARGEFRGTRLGGSLPEPAPAQRGHLRGAAADEEVALAVAAPEFQWA
jgi:uncharacterized protein (DUF1800 family)